MANALGIEEARIITISTIHLHPETIEALENACSASSFGPLKRGPSVAMRDEGFLINSHLGDEDALAQDIKGPVGDFPDLMLIRALARGLKADWLNIDRDGVEYTDILPSYRDGEVDLPTGEGWKDCLSETSLTLKGELIVRPSRAVLEMIEAGQTPTPHVAPDPGN